MSSIFNRRAMAVSLVACTLHGAGNCTKKEPVPMHSTSAQSC